MVHTRYDFLSVIRSIELILGMKPLGLFDALGTPMYDAFQAQPSNDAPFDGDHPRRSICWSSNPTANTCAARAVRPLDKPRDWTASRSGIADRLLWWSIHGDELQAPASGSQRGMGERRPRRSGRRG